jgi:hypothetical protein
MLLYSFVSICFVFGLGIVLFNRAQRTFIDAV